MRLPAIPRKSIPFIAVILTGIALRIYCLPCESFWLDEGFTLSWASHGILYAVGSSIGDVQAPLYFVIMNLWVMALGNSETALRLPSLLAGIASIPLFYVLADRLTGRKAGIIATVIFSLSTFQIYFSQEARPYSLFLFLSLASMYFFFSLGNKERKTRLLYIVSTVLMVYTHDYAVFMVLAQNVMVLLSGKRGGGLMDWISLQTTIFLLSFPWLAAMAFQVLRSSSAGSVISWIPVPTLSMFMETFFNYSGYYYLYPWGYGTEYFATLSTVSLFLSVTVILLAAKPFLAIGRKRLGFRLPENGDKLLIWLTVPIFIPLLISLVFFPIYWPRFTIAASPAFYMLAAMGINSVSRKHVKTLVISAIIVLMLVNNVRYHYEINKEQWREAADMIDSESSGGDLILFYKGFATSGPMSHYLVKDYDIVPIDEYSPGSLAGELAGHDSVWLVLSEHLYIYDATGKAIISDLEENFDQTASEGFVGIDLYHFERL
jgi:mannosyltransferase